MLRRRRSGIVLRGYRRGGEPREWVILEGSIVVVRTRVVFGVHGLVHDDDLVVDRRDLLAVSLAPSPSSRVHRGPDDAQSRSAGGVVVRGLVLVHGLGDDVIGLERRVGDVPERTVVTRSGSLDESLRQRRGGPPIGWTEAPHSCVREHLRALRDDILAIGVVPHGTDPALGTFAVARTLRRDALWSVVHEALSPLHLNGDRLGSRRVPHSNISARSGPARPLSHFPGSMSTLGASLDRAALAVGPKRIVHRTARCAVRTAAAAASDGGVVSGTSIEAASISSSTSSSRRIALASLVAAASVDVADQSALASAEPTVGDCPECVGVINELLNSCPPETEACVSSQDDNEEHFIAPFAYPGDRTTAMRRLVAVATGVEAGRVAGEVTADGSSDENASIDVYGRDKREVAEFILGTTGAFIRGTGLPPKPPIRGTPTRGGGGMGVGLVGKVLGADDAGAGSNSVSVTATRVAAYDENAGYVRLVAGEVMNDSGNVGQLSDSDKDKSDKPPPPVFDVELLFWDDDEVVNVRVAARDAPTTGRWSLSKFILILVWAIRLTTCFVYRLRRRVQV